MKKHPLRYGVTAVFISILFFIVAAVGFYHMIFLKLPASQPPAGGNLFYKAGYATGKYFAFYLAPFFNAFVGWLLFKFGREKVNAASVETPGT